jgi:hypothetical protein
MPTESSIRSTVAQSFLDLMYGPAPRSEADFDSQVLWDDEGSDVVRDAILSGKPCLVARLGSSELACISFYARWRARRLLPVPYPRGLKHIMRVNAGVFPVDDEALDRFSEIFLSAVKSTDVMGVWFNRNEHRIVHEFCPSARLVHLEALNTVIRSRPWSSALAGKVVLVIHPFAETIESQYRTRRAVLFEDPNVLPAFELKTMTAVQSAAENTGGFSSWFDALDHMRAQLADTAFDVALIGAGAYGLPLAWEAKRAGRQAVHLGAATQLLFGIRGRRWELESPDVVAPLFNQYWVRPSPKETPDGSARVEGGCYW